MYKSRQSIQNRHCVFSFEIKILGGSLMQIVEDFKYLGLWRNSNFTFIRYTLIISFGKYMDVDKLRISCLMHSADYLLLYFNIQYVLC